MNRKVLSAIALMSVALTAKSDGLPPLMGWSSWNTYGLDINENLIKEQADAMVSTGLKDAGYNFINIDDGFWNGRAADGTLIIDQTKFPNGMRVVADYIHSLGLKAGIYSDAGDNTCGSQNTSPYGLGVGLWRHEEDDIRTYFIDWDYDFIKVDYCGGTHLNLDDQIQYTKISNAIRNCGKEDARFNICRWAYPGTWVEDLADSWRTTNDIYDSWTSVKGILAENLYLSAYCRNGHYNDMDMLEVGRSLTPTEDLTHFAMWCIMDSPLLVGCDMRDMKASTIELLTNPELIALNQDPLHLQAYPAVKSGQVYVLVKDVETKYGLKRAFILYNPTDYIQVCSLDFSSIDLGGNVALRDLAERTDIGTFTDKYRVNVPAHGVKVYMATGEVRLERARYEAECGYISDYQEIKSNEVFRTGIYTYSDICSCGMKACWLGYGEKNDLVFDNVYSENGGEYEMTVAFLSADDREVMIDVNGEPQGMFMANSGSYDKVGRHTVKITLAPGENAVRLYNTDYFMPDIDYFDLKYIGEAEDTGVTELYKEESESYNYYDISGRRVINPEAGKIYIRQGASSSTKVVY